MTGFETFRRPAPESDRPEITVGDGDTLRLNEASIRALRTPHAVELQFDPEVPAIALRSVHPDQSPDAFDVDFLPEGGARVNAEEFLRHYGLAFSEPRRLPAYMDKGVLRVDVGEVAR
ncbi:hypothetical protein ACQP2Y_21045 [Actinoplanes sp. CA-051413]|uniref:hypothetical protein n=1 Tax=Actinoplanes sp. CA-051413 TaxID=3239899 RepID=UPI003D98DA07